jgi:trk system potassium uptake protein TrkH
MSASVYVLGFLSLLVVRWPEMSSAATTSATQMVDALRHPILSSTAAAINARSAGLPFEHAGAWPRAAQWIVIVLMFIGASTAGTGGGLKVTTLFELGRGARQSLALRTPPRTLGIALAWLGIYVLLIIVTMTLLLRSEGALPGDRALFIATSAASNTGLSLDPIAITGTGLNTLSAVMLIARVLPWLILWWAALTTREADVAVG